MKAIGSEILLYVLYYVVQKRCITTIQIWKVKSNPVWSKSSITTKNWKFWYILIFVNILSRFDKSEIGQQLETSSFESFLSIGTTMADLSIDGNTSKKKKLSKGSESQQKMYFLSRYSIFAEIHLGLIC